MVLPVKTKELGNSSVLNTLLIPAGAIMGSRLRKWLSNPMRTLQGANIQVGQTVLEVGCGTGFFTFAAAKMVGDQGHLIAMDVLSGFVEQLKKKVDAAGLSNVEVVQRDALNTGREVSSIDTVLLFGVIPYFSLPLDQLLPEMHRILKPGGAMSVWLFPFSVWVPRTILQSGLFDFVDRRNGVYNYTRHQGQTS